MTLQGRNDTYTLTKNYLGGGAFGSVWKGFNSRGDQVAIKQVILQKTIPNMIDIIESEVGILNRVSRYPDCSQYIVCFYDFIKVDGDTPICYIVMELLEGKSLNDIRIEARDIPKYLEDVSKGIEQLHKAGIIHRDLKPENIVLGKNGRAKVIDLGLGCAIIPVPGVKNCSGLGGTISFIDPRAFLKTIETADKTSDIFSLGTTFLDLLYEDIPKYLGSGSEGMRGKYEKYSEKILSKIKGEPYITHMLLDMANPTDAAKRPTIEKVLESLKRGAYEPGESEKKVVPERKLAESDVYDLLLKNSKQLLDEDLDMENRLGKPDEYVRIAQIMLEKRGVVVPPDAIRKVTRILEEEIARVTLLI